MLIYGQHNLIPSIEDSYLVEKGDLRKRFKYLQRCKNNAQRRWTDEYLKALKERHNLKHNISGKVMQPVKGSVVLVKGDDQNRGIWKLAIVTDLFPGSDGIIQSSQGEGEEW